MQGASSASARPPEARSRRGAAVPGTGHRGLAPGELAPLELAPTCQRRRSASPDHSEDRAVRPSPTRMTRGAFPNAPVAMRTDRAAKAARLQPDRALAPEEVLAREEEALAS